MHVRVLSAGLVAAFGEAKMKDGRFLGHDVLA
jgi:hypothetical protein